MVKGRAVTAMHDLVDDGQANPPAGRREVTDGYVPRPRLVRLLDPKTSPIHVLSAPSGFGKTTLVRDWLESSPPEAIVVWVAFGTPVASRHAFWETVLTSARRLGHLSAESSTRLLDEVAVHEDPVAPIAAFLASHGPVVLVLDAYEKLGAATADVDADLLQLVSQAPWMHVVVTTRAPTSLDAHVHRLRDRVRLIGPDHLRLSVEETASSLRAHRPEMAALDVERVHRDTRGYPLGVRAVGIALSRIGITPSGSLEWRTLVAEDLGSQLADPVLHAFVRDTAAPPYFDLDLAERLGGVDAPKLVAVLEQEGFGRWVPYAPGRPVFQYVESVRDAYEEQAIRDRPQYRRQAGLAAEWLYANAEHEPALELAIAGERYDLASRIFRSLLVASPESYTSDRLVVHLGRIPSAVLARHPVLAFAMGVAALSNVATRGAAVEYFRVAARRATEDLSGLNRAEVLVHHTFKVASLRVIRRYEESAAAASRAVDFLDAMDLGEQDAFAELVPIVLRHLAYSMFLVGDIGAARTLVTRAALSARDPWSRNYTLVYGLGIHAIDGRRGPAEATARLVEPDAWPRDHAYTYMNAMGRIGRSALLLDTFDLSGAIDQYDGCESFVDTAEFWPFMTWTLMHARLGLGEAATEAYRVESALSSPPAPPGMGANLGASAVAGALALLWLATGRADKAMVAIEDVTVCRGQVAPAAMLGRLLAGRSAEALEALPGLEIESGHTVRSTIALLTLGAAAALRVESNGTATGLLGRAAALWSAHGARAHLMYVPDEDLERLRTLAAESGSRTMVDYLDCEVPSAFGSAGPLLPRLSPRELEVLRAMIQHAARREVAAALQVSSHTVKSQVQSIYRKLGVNSRDALIRRALELDLI
jgi:LuxR family maltose regulon positive regulatory protein